MKLAKSESSFQLAPEDTMQGVVVDVVDMGMMPGFNEGEMVPKLKLVFQLEEETDEGVPYQVQSFPLNASLNSRSTLYKNYIKPILGRDLTEDDFDEEGEIDIDSLLIGKNAQVTVVHKTKNDKTYANVEQISPLSKKQASGTLLEPRNYVRQKDRTSFDPDTIEADADRV